MLIEHIQKIEMPNFKINKNKCCIWIYIEDNITSIEREMNDQTGYCRKSKLSVHSQNDRHDNKDVMRLTLLNQRCHYL